jgi:hypothetical protein
VSTPSERLKDALNKIGNGSVDVPTLIEKYFPDDELGVSEFSRWAGRQASTVMAGFPAEQLAGTVFLTALLTAMEYRDEEE